MINLGTRLDTIGHRQQPVPQLQPLSRGERQDPQRHFDCCVNDGLFASGEDGQIHFAEVAALRPQELDAVQQVRERVLRWFARPDHLDPVDARDLAGWDHGGVSRCMPRAGSKAPTAPAWSGCYPIVLGHPSP